MKAFKGISSNRFKTSLSSQVCQAPPWNPLNLLKLGDDSCTGGFGILSVGAFDLCDSAKETVDDNHTNWSGPEVFQQLQQMRSSKVGRQLIGRRMVKVRPFGCRCWTGSVRGESMDRSQWQVLRYARRWTELPQDLPDAWSHFMQSPRSARSLAELREPRACKATHEFGAIISGEMPKLVSVCFNAACVRFNLLVWNLGLVFVDLNLSKP